MLSLRDFTCPIHLFLSHSLESHAHASSPDLSSSPLVLANLGAVTYASAISFSGGIAPPLATPIITTRSPEGTCFTTPRNHPVPTPLLVPLTPAPPELVCSAIALRRHATLVRSPTCVTKSSNKQRYELLKIQQQRKNEVFKIQQERENELFKIQQQIERRKEEEGERERREVRERNGLYIRFESVHWYIRGKQSVLQTYYRVGVKPREDFSEYLKCVELEVGFEGVRDREQWKGVTRTSRR